MKSFDIVRNLTFTLGVFLILIQPVASFATAPRTSALGGDNTYFEDDSNVLRWYGSLVEYGNQVLVGTGHHDFSESGVSWSDSPSGFGTGIHVDLDSNGKWGTAALYFHEQMRDGDVSTSIDEDPGDSFTVLYGRTFGSVLVGLSLQHGSDEWTMPYDSLDGLPEMDRSFDRTTMGIGIRTDVSSSIYIDAAVDLRRLYWDNPEWRGIDEFNDWYSISMRTRAFFALGTNMALVPSLEFWSEDFLTRDDWGFWMADTHNNKMFRIGCGLNFFPNSDNFMLVSADYRDFRDIKGSHVSDLEFSYEADLFNLLIATETRWNHWLTLRGSAGFQYLNIEDGTTIFPHHETVFPLSFGAGFHLGGFDLDMAMTSHEPGLLNPNWQSLYSEEPSVQMPGSWFSASLRYLF